MNVFTKERGIVMDPYMGSGTTGVACEKLGRNFIGIGKDGDFIGLPQGGVDSFAQGAL